MARSLALSALATALSAASVAAAAGGMRSRTNASLNSSATPSWIAVGPSATAGSFDLFDLSSAGVKGNIIATFPVAAAEVAQDGAFDCGRGYCMMLTQLPATKQTVLRNFSFFAPAGLLNTFTLPFLAWNLDTNEAENDDGFNAFTVIQDHSKVPTVWTVAEVTSAGKVTHILDISANVGATGSVMQGATAYCGGATQQFFVAVSRRGAGAGDTDVMLTVDLANKRVSNTVNLNMPSLASHYATCGGSEGALSVGGAMVVSSGFGRHAIVVGAIDQKSGVFSPIDAADLPAAGAAAIPFDISSIMSGVSPFSMSYGAVLYSGFNKLPGLLFVSYPANGRGSATVSPLEVLVYGISEMF